MKISFSSSYMLYDRLEIRISMIKNPGLVLIRRSVAGCRTKQEMKFNYPQMIGLWSHFNAGQLTYLIEHRSTFCYSNYAIDAISNSLSIWISNSVKTKNTYSVCIEYRCQIILYVISEREKIILKCWKGFLPLALQ